MLDFPDIRQLRSPLTPDHLRPVSAEVRRVQFDEPLSSSDLARVAEFLRGYPEVTLRVYGYRTYASLDFLELFGNLRNFHVEIHQLEDSSGLRFLRPDLVSLGIGATRR